jgi:hypothetical protein
MRLAFLCVLFSARPSGASEFANFSRKNKAISQSIEHSLTPVLKRFSCAQTILLRGMQLPVLSFGALTGT